MDNIKWRCQIIFALVVMTRNKLAPTNSASYRSHFSVVMVELLEPWATNTARSRSRAAVTLATTTNMIKANKRHLFSC